MTVKHPKGPPTPAGTYRLAPIFTFSGDHIRGHQRPAGELAPDVAYQIITTSCWWTGTPRRNLASFVSTWIAPNGAGTPSNRAPPQIGSMTILTALAHLIPPLEPVVGLAG